MSGSAIGLSLNLGYAGNYSRTPDCIIETKSVEADSEDIPFGKAVVLNSDNTVSSAESVTISATNFLGVASAIVKQLNSYQAGQDQTQAGFYSGNEGCPVLKRGDVVVKCVAGTPTAGGAVYVRKTANLSYPDEVPGDFRAEADGSNTVQLTNCCWKTGRIDANDMAELTLKTINN